MLAVYARLRGRTITITACALAALVLTGCSEDPTGTPGPRAERDTVVLAFSGDSAGFRAFGGRSGRALGRGVIDPESRLGLSLGTARDRNAGLLFANATVIGPDAFGELIAVRFPGLEVAWREPLDDLEAQLEEGTDIRTGAFVSLSADGERLYLLARRGPRRPPGEFGVVPVNVSSRAPLGYLGGFAGDNRKIAPVRAAGGAPPLVIIGGPRSAEAVRLMIYRDEGEGLPVLQDSVSLFEPPPLDDDLSVRLDRVFSGRDGRHVYVRSADSLFKVDVREGEIVARGPRARHRAGVAAVLQDPARLVLTDAGFFDSPGSGALQLYDGDLNDLGTLDIGLDAMRGIAVGPRGDRVFVADGTPERFGGFVRETSVAVVDIRRDSLLRVHEVGGFGVRDIHVF